MKSNVPKTADLSVPMMTVKDVAAFLTCATRTVYRMKDGGKIPRPKKIGGLVRWDAAALNLWREQGCKPCRI